MSISPLFFPPALSPAASDPTSAVSSTSTTASSTPAASNSPEEDAYLALELNYRQRRLPSHRQHYDMWIKQKNLYEELRTDYLAILESCPWWAAKVEQLESVMEAVREGIKLAAKDARRFEKRLAARKAAGLADEVDPPGWLDDFCPGCRMQTQPHLSSTCSTSPPTTEAAD